VVALAFNPSTWEAEAGGFLSSRPAWSTKWVPGQPGLHRETMSRKTKKKKKKKKDLFILCMYSLSAYTLLCLKTAIYSHKISESFFKKFKHFKHAVPLKEIQGWRDGSVVKSTDCSSRGPEFKSQQPHCGS
jgi:hypothetical protein